MGPRPYIGPCCRLKAIGLYYRPSAGGRIQVHATVVGRRPQIGAWLCGEPWVHGYRRQAAGVSRRLRHRTVGHATCHCTAQAEPIWCQMSTRTSEHTRWRRQTLTSARAHTDIDKESDKDARTHACTHARTHARTHTHACTHARTHTHKGCVLLMLEALAYGLGFRNEGHAWRVRHVIRRSELATKINAAAYTHTHMRTRTQEHAHTNMHRHACMHTHTHSLPPSLSKCSRISACA